MSINESYQEKCAREEKETLAAIPKVLEQLNALTLGITSVNIEYSGSGDSGEIEELSFSVANGHSLDNISLPDGLEDEIGDLALDLLTTKHPGWEINDGSRGTVLINITTGEIELQHVKFYTDETNYELAQVCNR